MPHNAVFLLTIQSLGGITIQYHPILEGKMNSTPTIRVHISAIKTDKTQVPITGRLVTKSQAHDLVDALNRITGSTIRIGELDVIVTTPQAPSCDPFEIKKPELYKKFTYVFEHDSHYPDFVELLEHARLITTS